MTMSTKSLCESVLTGSEVSERIIIHDSAECSGRPLLKLAVSELLKRCEIVHLFLYEGDTEQWTKGLPVAATTKLMVHDCKHALVNANDSLQPLESHSAVASRKTVAVVVDSLSSVLLRSSPSSLCRWVTTLPCPHLLALLHSDLHSEGVLVQLNYMATSRLVVTASKGQQQNNGTVTTTHRRPSGKILRQSESYQVSPDYVTMTTANHVRPVPPTTTKKTDPAANLTFDLHLSAEEEEARSHVVLPYTRAQQDGQTAAQQGRGEIFYETDEMDEFEDSDPDDDLDF